MSIIASSGTGDAGNSADQGASAPTSTEAGLTPTTTPTSTAPVPPNPVHPGDRGSTEPPDAANGRRRWPAVGAIVLIAAATGGAYALLAGGDGDAAEAEPATIRAVTAEQRDLIEFTDLDGTLGYAETRSVGTVAAGTITAIVDDGAAVERGDAVYELDAEPVVALYGDVPFYRPLEEGDEGDDVALLEANLAALGHHLDQDPADLDDGEDEIDTGFTVDGVFDAATTEAVRRWQVDLDRPDTGRVALGDVVIVDGPAVASAVAVEVGSLVQAGAPVLELNVTGTEATFHSAHSGVLRFEAAPGPVTSGQVLYVVDDRPITAVVTEETFDRDLSDGVADGEDVRVLEDMLVTLGHDARGDLVPDDEFDEITTEAVEDWQESLEDTWDDVEVDGVVSLDDILVVEPGTIVGSIDARIAADDDRVVATGSELFRWSGDGGGRVVTTTIDVAEQAKLAEGVEVDIAFPDGSIVVGTVVEVATSSTVDPTDPDAEARLAVEISLPEVPASAADLNELDVEVRLVDELAAGATVVPASALVVTADGGYAVEVVDGTTTSFVAVDPGMFADGFVEVDGISPGTAVVVPS